MISGMFIVVLIILSIHALLEKSQLSAAYRQLQTDRRRSGSGSACVSPNVHTCIVSFFLTYSNG